jgi:hypothetical protein
MWEVFSCFLWSFRDREQRIDRLLFSGRCDFAYARQRAGSRKVRNCSFKYLFASSRGQVSNHCVMLVNRITNRVSLRFKAVIIFQSLLHSLPCWLKTEGSKVKTANTYLTVYACFYVCKKKKGKLFVNVTANWNHYQ